MLVDLPRIESCAQSYARFPPTRSGKFTKISIPLPWWYTLTLSGKFTKIPIPPLGTVKTYPDPERKAYKKISRLPLRYPEDIPWPRRKRLPRNLSDTLQVPWGYILTGAGSWQKSKYPYRSDIPVPWSPFTLTHTPCPLPGRGEDSGKQAG
jgi:hypothetical protein